MVRTFTFLLLLFCSIIFSASNVYGQLLNEYRSFSDGNWNNVNTWERFDGTSWVNPAPATPTNIVSVVTIQNGHAVTVTAGVTVDQVVIQSGGEIIINPTVTLTLANGSGNEITVNTGGILTNNGIIAFGGIPNRVIAVNGDLNNSGSFTAVTAAKLTFGSGSNYYHQFADGGTIPAATWNANSTVNIVGYTSGNSTPPSGLGQTFGHFVWNAPGQDATIVLNNFGSNTLPTTINGDFRVEDTGIDALFYSQGGAGNTMTIGGDLDINGGTLGWTSGDAGASTLNISGDIDISGAGYVQFADDQDLTVNVTGDFILSGSAQVDFSASTATTNLNVQGDYNHSGGDIFVNGAVGNVNFVGASTKVFTSTIVPLGPINYSVASSSTLTVSGSNFIGGGGTFTLAGVLQVGSTDAGGALQAGTTGGNLQIPTANRTFQSGSTIVYNGSGAQFIGDGFPPSGDVNLTINNASGVSLSDDLEIVALRTLTLTSGNLVIGAQTLTINGTVTGVGGMVGGPSSNLVIGGTGDFGTLTFSGTNQLLNFTINRTGSGLVTLGDDLTILGTFTQTDGDVAIGSNTLTISGAFARTAGDLSVTSASTIIINGTGAMPADVGFAGTGLGTLTLNRAGSTLSTNSSLAITNLNLTAGIFNNGTGIAMTAGGTITRAGSGSMNTAPNNTTDAYNVVYNISSPISSGAELPSNTTALGNLTKSGSATLTLTSDITVNGVLTLSSGVFNASTRALDLKGNFVSNASSTLTSSVITFSGTTAISGSATPTFGTITITGALTPTSSFQINGNLVNNGTLNAGSATTIFGGTTAISGSSVSSFNNVTISGTLTAPTGNMRVAGTWTNNGTFNRGAATNTVTFNGTSSIAGSASTTFSGITITGTLNAPATLNLAGHFTNNGTFNRGTGTVVFNGSSFQQITGSAVTNFNNITVSNTGSSVQVASNQNLHGVLTLTGTSIFDADGSGAAVFTLVSTSDDPTSDAGIATLPAGTSVTGNVTVQRYMSLEGTNNRLYRYISSPVQSPAVSQLQTEIPVTGTFTGASSCSGCGTNQSMFLYNESLVGDVNTGYSNFPAAANTETLTAGRGYSIYVRGNIDPILSAGSARWDVRAAINTGTIVFPATFTSSGTLANDGWNLVGNPYPSTIDWDAASGWTRTGINNAIYMTDNGQGGVIASYVGGVGTNGGSRYIAMGQGFFVKSDGGPVSFSATESVKVAGQQTSFFREASRELIRIALRQGDIRDETVVRFTDAATAEFDREWDAYKLPNASMNLSSRTVLDQKLAINSLPTIMCGAIKLSVQDVEAGQYQLDFSQLESINSNIRLELFDAYTGTTSDMRTTPSYSFNVTSDSTSYGDNRFEVRLSPATLPTVTLTTEANKLVSSYATGNQWYFNGEPIPGATGQSIEADQSGVYEVEVAVNGCSLRASREMIILDAEAGSSIHGLELYPNPVTEKFIVRLPNRGPVTSEVSSVLGQPLGAVKFVPDGDKLKGEFDLGSYPSGLYLLKIEQGYKTTNYKVIKK